MDGCSKFFLDFKHQDIKKDYLGYLIPNHLIKKYNKEKELIRSIVKMKPFIDADFVNINNNKLTIKNEARPLARIISSCFDQYFLKNENKYSVGI